MKKTLLILPFLWVAAASAAITLSTGAPKDRVGKVGGLLITPSDPAFTREFTEGDRELSQTVRFDALTLVSRDTLANFIGVPDPLYLKVYDSAARTTLLGESTNAFRWDMGGAVSQTYNFESLTLDATKAYYFVFETARGPRAAIGLAGLRVTEGFAPGAAGVLGDTLNLAQHYTLHRPIDAVVSIGLSSPSSSAPGAPASGAVSAKASATEKADDSSWPAILGGVLGALAIIAAAGFFVYRRKRPAPSAAPVRPAGPVVLPPPPGRDR